jgi:hypothetical protein
MRIGVAGFDTALFLGQLFTQVQFVVLVPSAFWKDFLEERQVRRDTVLFAI